MIRQGTPLATFSKSEAGEAAEVYIFDDISLGRRLLYSSRMLIPPVVRQVPCGMCPRFRIIFNELLLFHFQNSVTRTETFFLESGHWFVSLYNDDGAPHQVQLEVRGGDAAAADRERGDAGDQLTECRGGCGGRGACVAGRCVCEAGYDAETCTESK